MKWGSLTILLFFSASIGWGQVNLDSLWRVWNDEGQADTARLKAMNKIAWNGYLFTQPDSAFYYAQLQYDLAKRKGLKKPMAAALNTQGVSFAIRSDYDNAIIYYKRCMAIQQELGNKKGIAGCLGNIGNIYSVQGNLPSAIDFYTRCLTIEEEIGNKRGIANALSNIGIGYRIQGDYASAIDYATRCLTIMEEIGNKQGVAISLNNIGLIYKTQGDDDAAVAHYNQCITIMEEIGDRIGIAGSLGNIGNIYSEQGDHASAIDYHTRSLIIKQEIGDKHGIATSLSNMGIVYKDQDNYESAIDYFTRSLTIREEIGDKQGMAASLCNIGNAYMDRGDYVNAITYSARGLNIAQEVGAAIETSSAANTLFGAYKATGRHKLSLEMHELYIATRDSIESEENHKEVIRQQFKYEYDKKEALAQAENQKKLDIAKEREEKQQVISIAAGGGALALGVLAVMIFISFRTAKRQRNEVAIQKNLLEERNKEITDSITYAKRIQAAILPPLGIVKLYLRQSFVYYQPKDVVAGDFYWMEALGDSVLFAAADCTGHGVPGAMVSVVCNNALNNAVREFKLAEPAAILDKVNAIVTEQFATGEYEVKDGMDIALVSLHTKTRQATYAGANNSLYHISDGELHQFKADKQPIGSFAEAKPFTSHSVSLKEGDSIYLSSDGFPDQFGGPKGKKYMYKRFRELLLANCTKPMDEQRTILTRSFEDWRGELEQVDDVCVIGVRV